MKYRKKPITIEAFQYDGDFKDEFGYYYVPHWAVKALIDGIIILSNEGLIIKTLEGQCKVEVGDYIIKGIKGEMYSCKPDIFEETYELIEK